MVCVRPLAFVSTLGGVDVGEVTEGLPGALVVRAVCAALVAFDGAEEVAGLLVIGAAFAADNASAACCSVAVSFCFNSSA